MLTVNKILDSLRVRVSLALHLQASAELDAVRSRGIMRRQIRWRRALGQSLAEGALRALAPRPLPIQELKIIRALGPFLAHFVRARTDLVRRLRLQVCEALETRPV